MSEVAATQGVPKEYFAIVAGHARGKADFLRDSIGCDDAITAMLRGAQAFADEQHAKITQVVCVGAQVSTEGVFSIKFVIVPFRVQSKIVTPRRRTRAPSQSLVG